MKIKRACCLALYFLHNFTSVGTHSQDRNIFLAFLSRGAGRFELCEKDLISMHRIYWPPVSLDEADPKISKLIQHENLRMFK